LEKIKAVNTLRMTGKIYVAGFYAAIEVEKKRGNLLRQDFTLQGMTQVQAYDGSSGWQIQPFGGRKDPELMGEDDMRDLIEESDIDGALVDYQAKGNKLEYLGHYNVNLQYIDQLKVTLKNIDVIYYYLAPNTYLEPS